MQQELPFREQILDSSTPTLRIHRRRGKCCSCPGICSLQKKDFLLIYGLVVLYFSRIIYAVYIRKEKEKWLVEDEEDTVMVSLGPGNQGQKKVQEVMQSHLVKRPWT